MPIAVNTTGDTGHLNDKKDATATVPLSSKAYL